MAPFRKILTVVLGDVYGQCGTDALNILRTHNHVEVLLVDDDLDALNKALPVFQKFGKCSGLHADIRTEQGRRHVINEIQQPGYWVQYLLNSFANFEPDSLNDDAKALRGGCDDSLLNEGVFEVTQVVLENMITHRNGMIRNLAMSPPSAYLVKQYGRDTALDFHTHPEGEIIMVLEGNYSDENGNSPAGEYLRNPPKSAHAPFSDDGCVILVSLQSVPEQDQALLRVNLNDDNWCSVREGVQIMPIHHYDNEFAAFIRYTDSSAFQPWQYFHGANLLTLPKRLCSEIEQGDEAETLVLVQTNDYAYAKQSFLSVLQGL
ncbi:hypothetical protein C1E23_10740 [Pseudoalteromonas phenolica]|uniref:ChrR-like cupin domain-containing protein n=1 Tax=Pseudoalteromonas phenolica TaxID=161398 RepID=A0A4V2EJP8_9GAMM|nr:cupin domain-containing protein [Pseudoalteromonas phenolica]RZQ53098.1 hypothetical protein C1E23_10740 [Pseudoalteromonas phenolica]